MAAATAAAAPVATWSARAVKWSRQALHLAEHVLGVLAEQELHLVGVLAHDPPGVEAPTSQSPAALVAQGGPPSSTPAPIENGLISAIPESVVTRPTMSTPP